MTYDLCQKTKYTYDEGNGNAKALRYFLDSGLSRKVYCEKHNINIHTFKYWQCKLAAKTKSSFLTVEIPKKSEVMASILQLEIQYPNGVKKKSGLDFEIIRQLISLV